MAKAKLPSSENDPQTGQVTDDQKQREATICGGILAALGRPARLYRVAVMPLWGEHFRVNVITGDAPSSFRIAHSYFVTTDGGGHILESSPVLRAEY